MLSKSSSYFFKSSKRIIQWVQNSIFLNCDVVYILALIGNGRIDFLFRSFPSESLAGLLVNAACFEVIIILLLWIIFDRLIDLLVFLQLLLLLQITFVWYFTSLSRANGAILIDNTRFRCWWILINWFNSPYFNVILLFNC